LIAVVELNGFRSTRSVAFARPTEVDLFRRATLRA
jgi:hypothetical protein